MRAASTAWTVAGTRMLVDRAGQAVGAALADQRAGLDQRADALLQEERVALGPLDQQRLQRLRRVGSSPSSAASSSSALACPSGSIRSWV